MIDFRELAAVAYEEARTFAEASYFSDAPELSGEAKFVRMCGECPLPPSEELARVIEEVFWASLLAEEGRPCRPRLIYAPPPLGDGQPVLLLEKPVRLGRAELRKLSPAHGDSGYATWMLFADDLPMITGIRSHAGESRLIVTGPGSGAVDIIWQGFRLLTFHGGTLLRLSTSRLPDLSKALTFVNNTVFGGSDVHFCHTIVDGIVRVGHGGSLWIVREGRSLEGLKLGHVLAVERPMLERFPGEEGFNERHRRLSSFAHLSAVDGALLLDSRCRPLGFGVFARSGDGPEAPPSPVSRLLAHGTVQQITSDKLGGGRHRSAVDFCRQFAPAAAFVVSQDGRITLVVGESGGLVSCAEIVSLGVSAWFS